MTTATEIAIVPICGTEMVSLREDGTVLVPMKHLSESVLLPWKPQHKRILRHPLMSKGIRVMEIPSAGGVQETVCLPVKLARMFLLTVPTQRITDERVRTTVLAWQEESLDAIDAYWSQGYAENPRARRQPAERPTSTRSLLAVYDRLKRSTDPVERTFLYSAMERENQQLDLPLPPMDRIGREAQDPSELIAPLVEGLWTLTSRGVTWDHARDNRRIAFNPREIGRLFDANDVDVQIDAAMRDALRRIGGELKTVNSAIVGKAIHCWVLSRSTATVQ